TLYDEHALNGGTFLQRLIRVGLERHFAAAAHALIRGDDDSRIAIEDAAHQTVRRETAENDGVDCADARAGEHGVGSFGDHRQVDRHPVAFFHAVLLEHIGNAADPLVQLPV